MKPLNAIPRILITPGEPAGIGPDITIQIAQQQWNAQLVVVADPDLLTQRAQQLNLPLNLIEVDLNAPPVIQPAGSLYILSVALKAAAVAGELNVANARYVIDTLNVAADLCLHKKADAVVTGPVHKGIINQANIKFSGHTEFFAERAGVDSTVMLFVVPSTVIPENAKHLSGTHLAEAVTSKWIPDKCFAFSGMTVALVTTHLPLSAVPAAITQEKLRDTITILNTALIQQFHFPNPRIAVCGLNPHAGENGYLGREEIEVISPALDELRQQGLNLLGPLSADTIFQTKSDAILAMYHDQALPLVKYISFGHAVNMTLGLPFMRTSVDHGTALDLAGTGKADPGSMIAAITLASTPPVLIE